MFTIVGYSAEITADGTYKNVAAVPDDHLKVIGNYVYISALNKLFGVYVAGGTNPNAAYLASPSLRKLAYFDIPLIEKAEGPVSDDCVRLFPESPLVLETNEGLELLIDGDASGAEVNTGIVFLSDGPIAPVSGEISTFKATVGTAANNTEASKWCSAPITFRQTLPVGRYQVVGAKLNHTWGVGFRFIPIGELHRPGGIFTKDIESKAYDKQRNGGMGVWFEFDSVTPPSIEILGNDAIVSDLDLYLDMIKIS